MEALANIAADGGFAENGTIWTIVGVLAIIALIIWIVRGR